MNALIASNLEDALLVENKPNEISKKNWDKIDQMTTQALKYQVMNKTSARKIWEVLEGKCLTKNVENHLHLKRRLYRFQLKKRIFIGEHMNNYTKLFANLANMKEVINDENKALILLSFFR